MRIVNKNFWHVFAGVLFDFYDFPDDTWRSCSSLMSVVSVIEQNFIFQVILSTERELKCKINIRPDDSIKES